MASSTAEVPSNGRQDVAGANLVAASLLVFFVIVSVIGIRLDSPTIDEPAHLLRGLGYW